MMVSSKQEIKCPECGQRLNVPLNYTGLVRCPACKAKTPVYEGSVQSEEVEVHSEETPVERELELFESDSYMIRKQVFTWFYSANFYIYSDESMENLIGFSGGFSTKSWGGSIYSDESMSTELLEISREGLLDAVTKISMGVYSITDRQTGEELGSMKRKVLGSVLKESWVVVDSSGNEVGTLSEDIPVSMMLHRLSNVRSAFNRGTALSWLAPKKDNGGTALSWLVPKKYVLRMNGAPGEVIFSRKMIPVPRKWTVGGVLSSGIDPRLAAGTALLLAGAVD